MTETRQPTLSPTLSTFSLGARQPTSPTFSGYILQCRRPVRMPARDLGGTGRRRTSGVCIRLPFDCTSGVCIRLHVGCLHSTAPAAFSSADVRYGCRHWTSGARDVAGRRVSCIRLPFDCTSGVCIRLHVGCLHSTACCIRSVCIRSVAGRRVSAFDCCIRLSLHSTATPVSLTRREQRVGNLRSP